MYLYSAGRGILHSEIPGNKEVSHGLQLWVNLAAKDKLCEPAYQELPASKVTKVTKNGITAHVIAGTALDTTSPIYTRAPTHYIHFEFSPNSELNHPIPAGWNSFIYTLDGEVFVGNSDKACEPHYTITLTGKGDGILLRTKSQSASFVLLAGKPHNEPIVQHGPFVMNTQQEIQQAFQDYQLGRNGFENAPGWSSKIAREFYKEYNLQDY